ncbi:MAG: DUF262 domain-containing HNH endonuclease family protein [Planctomycetes bacterium]|nr:DUF262 domain-containing HNH endonuclease family protein [Planctomycetota bacterium]
MTQRIESHDKSIADVFKDFYIVPDYQREYVWGTEEVEQLLGDIRDEYSLPHDPVQAPEYFIGSIVVCPSPAGAFEVIDGQQRLTTLFLSLCAIRDHIRELGQTPQRTLESQICDWSTDSSGKERERFKVVLQYADSEHVLERIARSEEEPAGSPGTRSIANIRVAYETSRAFLRREFKDDPDAVRRFYAYLINSVKLIRIVAEDVAKALKIFETINDRGVGLDAMDLLKNLLFMKANREDFDALKGTWKALQDTLFGIREKPLRFLRYFIFSNYDVALLREDEIYSWFSKHEKECGYALRPLEFGTELLEAARAYSRFFQGEDRSGKKSPRLENMQLLGGKSARQHLILLLAGRHMEDSLFERLCHEVESLFFCYVITREPTRDFERNFASWAKELRKVRTAPELDRFIGEKFHKAKADLSGRFDDAMKRMDAESLQQYRLRYLLAKLTQSVEVSAYGENEGTRWLANYVGGGYEIEHIYPRNPNEAARREFGPSKSPLLAERLGNLVLVEKSINSSLGNRPYSEKRTVYPRSKLLLTRTLAERHVVGKDTRIDSAVAGLPTYAEWNEANVDARQLFLTRMARRVWAVPDQKV